MIGNLFGALTQGTKFSKKRHGFEMNLFTNQGRPKSQKLDLFGDTLTEEMDTHESVESGEEVSPASDDEDEDVNSDGSASDKRTSKTTSSRDEINSFRNRLKIKARGDNIPDPSPTFKDMNISDAIKSVVLRNVEESKWKEPTPIQMQAIPALLLGRDVLAAAPTGSGKTAAFVIPILSKLQTSKKAGIRAIILAPTRELAEQIHREAMRLSAGKKIKISLLKKSVAATALAQQSKGALASIDLLVATPMRLLSLVRAEAIDLSKVEIVVLDEVDKLFELDSGSNSGSNIDPEDDDVQQQQDTRSSFLNQVDEIFHQCPQEGLQRGLFSATIGPLVQELASGFLRNPIQINIGIENAGATTIKQRLMFVGREDGKLLAIRQLVQEGLKPPVLIFLQNKDRAKDLFRELVYDGINVDIIHSERTQQQREEVIKRFRVGDIWVLICTDLMARGVDFKGVKMVINYDLPQSAVAYIHRIGRTGRAGKEGEAVTFFTEADVPKMRPIVNVMKLSGSPVPEWLLNIKQMSTREKRQLRKSAPERRSISTSVGRTFHEKKPVKKPKNGRPGSK